MTQEMIMMFLLGLFFGLAIHAVFESVKLWEIIFDCYYWIKDQLERIYKWSNGKARLLGRIVTGNM